MYVKRVMDSKNRKEILQMEKIPEMKPFFRDSNTLEKLTTTTIKAISNGYILKTRAGWWYYPTVEACTVAMANYLGVMAKEYKGLMEKSESK